MDSLLIGFLTTNAFVYTEWYPPLPYMLQHWLWFICPMVGSSSWCGDRSGSGCHQQWAGQRCLLLEGREVCQDVRIVVAIFPVVYTLLFLGLASGLLTDPSRNHSWYCFLSIWLAIGNRYLNSTVYILMHTQTRMGKWLVCGKRSWTPAPSSETSFQWLWQC